ncbi:MAG: hypothetical protein FJ211_10875, partial [Ignavibacteria bacterium]|nr:hypothetical protein [Ignavibacteria bacterium]
MSTTHKTPSTMPRPLVLRLGEGATCSVLLKFLRPSREVSERFPNAAPTQRLDDLVAVRFAVVTRGRSTYPAVFFTTPTFPGLQLQAAKKKVKVLQEGNPGSYWGDVPNVPFELPPALQAPVDGRDDNFDDDIFFARNNAEDIARVRAEGFEVDDDNDPAPENVPQLWDAPRLTDAGLYEGQRWGWNGIDRRVTEGGNYNGPSFANGWTPIGKTYMEIFLHLFPVVWLTDVLIRRTNVGVINAASKPFTFGECLRFIGMRLLMASSPGWSVDDYWCYDNTPRDQTTDPCPYNFRDLMGKKRFHVIGRNLAFTDVPPPTYVDRFWQIRQMIHAWNEHMANIFLAAWIVCLDESMSIWHTRWTCPGWVFCPRKPHPFGNEYHSACCGISTIMFVIEMVEGKDAPALLRRPYEAMGKTAGLLLRMLSSYFGTGRYIVLDSGFCVLKALVELKRNGLFGC